MAVASEGDFFGEEVANGKDGKEVDAVENDGHGPGKGIFLFEGKLFEVFGVVNFF